MKELFTCPDCGRRCAARRNAFPLHCACGSRYEDADAGEWLPREQKQKKLHAPREPEPLDGPGTRLKKILASMGIHDTAGCGCENMLRKMNAWGPDGCRTHRQEIVDHLRAKAAERGWMLTEWLPVGVLVDRAIKLSE